MSTHGKVTIVDFKKVNMKSKTEIFTDDMARSSFVFPVTGEASSKNPSFPKIGSRKNRSTQPQRKFR